MKNHPPHNSRLSPLSCRLPLASATKLSLPLASATKLNLSLGSVYIDKARRLGYKAKQVVGITGFILTKLDGSARSGCVDSVVVELGIPVKFVGVEESVEGLQPSDAGDFLNAIFSKRRSCRR